MRRLLRDPVFQFVVLGLAFFLVDRVARALHPTRDESAIVVSQGFVAGLREEERRTLGRAPDDRALEALVDSYVREEALVRSARDLGLERSDAIVRRRLAQKMEFVLRGTLDVPPPTDAEIRAYVAAHSSELVAPKERAFVHAFFSRSSRGDSARSDASAALVAARAANDPVAALAGVGDAFALGSTQALAPPARIAGRFGEGFAAALDACMVRVPCGPLESAYGYHVVVLTDARESAPLPEAEARARVLPVLTREKEEAARESRIREEVARYRVVRERARDETDSRTRSRRARPLRRDRGRRRVRVGRRGPGPSASSRVRRARREGARARALRPRFPLLGRRVEPRRLDARPARRLRLDAPLRETPLENGIRVRGAFRCARGLEGKALRVTGLTRGGSDVAVRVRLLTGRTHEGLVGASEPAFTVPSAEPETNVLGRYVVLGIEHIALGLDHLLFVLGLFLLVDGARRLVATITAFTVGHSITLALAALSIDVPAAPDGGLHRALDRARRGTARAWRSARDGAEATWAVASTFGLLHGLGFAGALAEVGLPEDSIPSALFGFNVGVEVGQLAFVLVLLAITGLARAPRAPRVRSRSGRATHHRRGRDLLPLRADRRL